MIYGFWPTNELGEERRTLIDNLRDRNLNKHYANAFVKYSNFSWLIMKLHLSRLYGSTPLPATPHCCQVPQHDPHVDPQAGAGAAQPAGRVGGAVGGQRLPVVRGQVRCHANKLGDQALTLMAKPAPTISQLIKKCFSHHCCCMMPRQVETCRTVE